MVDSRFRCGIIALLLVVLGLQAGCSALRFGYNQADELAYWWLDGYADFNDKQAVQVRQALAQWFAWHRRTQLPDYAALLMQAQAEAMEPVSGPRLCQWWSNARSRIDIALDAAIPTAAEILVTLTPQQIARIERRYEKSNAEYTDDYLQGDASARLKASIKRTLDRAESFYGRLDDAQRDRLARSVAQSPFDANLVLGERKARQQDALQMLRRLKAEGGGRAQAEAALRGYLERVAQSPRPEYRRYALALTEFNCQFSADIHNSASLGQRQTLVGKLKGWEGDLRALMSAN